MRPGRGRGTCGRNVIELPVCQRERRCDRGRARERELHGRPSGGSPAAFSDVLRYRLSGAAELICQFAVTLECATGVILYTRGPVLVRTDGWGRHVHQLS